MPLDFSIPMQTRGIQFNDPFQTLGEAARRREEREDRQILNDQRMARLGDLRKKDEEEAALRSIFQEANGDTRAAARIMRQRGMVEKANEIESSFNKLEKEENEAIDGHFTTLANVLSKGGALLGSIKPPTGVRNSGTVFSIGATKPDAPAAMTEDGGVTNSFGAKKGLSIPFDGTPDDSPEWKRAQDAFNAVRPEIVSALNRLSPEMAKLVPDTYDPEAVEALIQQGRTYEQVYRDRAEAAKNSKPPSNDDMLKMDKSILEMYGPAFLLTADTPEEQTEYLDRMSKRGASGMLVDGLRKMSRDEQREFITGGASGDSWTLPAGEWQGKVDGKWVDMPVVYNAKLGAFAPQGAKSIIEARRKPDAPKTSGDATDKKDDPRLPNGVKSWIDSLAEQNPNNRAAVEALLESDWTNQRSMHPNVSIVSAGKYLDDIYGPKAKSTVDERESDQKMLEKEKGNLARQRMIDQAVAGVNGDVIKAIQSLRDANTQEGSEAADALALAYKYGSYRQPSPSSLGGMRPSAPPVTDMMQRGQVPPPNDQMQRGQAPSPTPMAPPARSGGAPVVQAPASVPQAPNPAPQAAKPKLEVKTFEGLPKEDMAQLNKLPNGQKFRMNADGEEQVWQRTSNGFVRVR